jgi:hypothetical protein
MAVFKSVSWRGGYIFTRAGVPGVRSGLPFSFFSGFELEFGLADCEYDENDRPRRRAVVACMR